MPASLLLQLLKIIPKSLFVLKSFKSKHSISDDVCDKLAAAARQNSEEMGISVCFSIFDPEGVMRLFRRFGNAQIMSVKLTPAKAYTTAISATPSEVFSKLAGMGQPLMDYTTICCFELC